MKKEEEHKMKKEEEEKILDLARDSVNLYDWEKVQKELIDYVNELLEQAEARGYRLGLADKEERR